MNEVPSNYTIIPSNNVKPGSMASAALEVAEGCILKRPANMYPSVLGQAFSRKRSATSKAPSQLPRHCS